MLRNSKLQEYFNFTHTDLQSNRMGQVTESQQIHVKGKVKQYNGRILIVLVLMFMLTVGGFVIFKMAARNAFQSFPIAMLGPIITLVILVVFMVSRTNRKNDFSLKKAEGTVNFVWVEERVRNTADTGADYRTVRKLEMRVGGVSFNVNQELMDILNQGDNVRFYYTGGGDIVSAEFVNH
jgi:hypothetical protein